MRKITKSWPVADRVGKAVSREAPADLWEHEPVGGELIGLLAVHGADDIWSVVHEPLAFEVRTRVRGRNSRDWYVGSLRVGGVFRFIWDRRRP